MIFQIWIESPDKSLKLKVSTFRNVRSNHSDVSLLIGPRNWSCLCKILSCERKGPFPSPICACKIDIQFCDSLSGGQSILSGVCCCRGTCFPLLCRNIKYNWSCKRNKPDPDRPNQKQVTVALGAPNLALSAVKSLRLERQERECVADFVPFVHLRRPSSTSVIRRHCTPPPCTPNTRRKTSQNGHLLFIQVETVSIYLHLLWFSELSQL